ncbi:hypothetical protein CDAR_532671 [Caerostris darwini]|uniref:Uncharacterized protein n=1 Tax=Caerostris darwini TaxID=1538125 RepID=A0AAV4VW95_9ARAC|nr:hypothetical protein CDAR_532671 [Caerostris darwini]
MSGRLDVTKVLNILAETHVTCYTLTKVKMSLSFEWGKMETPVLVKLTLGEGKFVSLYDIKWAATSCSESLVKKLLLSQAHRQPLRLDFYISKLSNGHVSLQRSRRAYFIIYWKN